MRLSKPRSNQGFTLIELLVISPIIMVVLVAATTYLFNQYGSLVKSDGQLNLQLEAQTILFGLQDDLWYADQFSSTINSNLSDSYQPPGGWSSSSSPAPLIISSPALTTNRRNVNRQPVYINESSCTPPDGNGVNSVLYNNIIYFVSSTNLYKRTVTAPSGLATCGSSYYKQTCPAANASSSCHADILLSDKLTSFNIVYYDTNNTVITTPEQAESVKVTVALKDKAYGDDITATSSLRLRKLNQ